MTAHLFVAEARIESPVGVDLREQIASLSNDERALLSSRALPKRIVEFVAGRAAARRAIRRFLGTDQHKITIVRAHGGAAGRPEVILRPADRPTPRVSISHYGRLAIAACADGYVGIDIVALEEPSQALLEEAFVRTELDAWREWLGTNAVDAAVFAYAFAAKEAMLKWLGSGLRTPLRSVRTRPVAPPRSCGAWQRFAVRGDKDLTAPTRFVAYAQRRQDVVILCLCEHADDLLLWDESVETRLPRA